MRGRAADGRPAPQVTIIPSGMALGVTMQLPEEDRHIYRADYILDRLVVMFGGRIAEELVFGISSTGAADDLMRATALARSMVREWGMSERSAPWPGDRRISVPGRGPRPNPRLQRRDGPGHRRGDGAHPAGAAGAVPRDPHRVPPRAGSGSPGPARARDDRRHEVERLIAVSRGDAPAAHTADDEPGLDAVPDPDSPAGSDTPATAEGNGAGTPAGVPTSAG